MTLPNYNISYVRLNNMIDLKKTLYKARIKNKKRTTITNGTSQNLIK